MSAQARIKQMLDRTRPEQFIPVLSYNEEDGLFYVDGGFVGACFMGALLPGVDEMTSLRLASALRTRQPPGTFIQFMQFASPDIEHLVAGYSGRRVGITPDTDPHHYPGRAEQIEILQELVRRRTRAISAGKTTELIPRTGIHSNNPVLVISIKIPVPNAIPSEREFRDAHDAIIKFHEALETAGLSLRQMGKAEYLLLMRRLLHMRGAQERWVDPERLIRDQVFEPGDAIKIDGADIELNDSVLRVLSVKTYPETMALGRMLPLAGDPDGIDNQIPCPFTLVTTLHYPDQRKKTGLVRSKSGALNFQAYGPIVKFAPIIMKKKQGIDVLIDALNDGDTVVEVNFTVTLYEADRIEAGRASAMLQTYYSSLGFLMAEEKYIAFPVFWNTLPLFPDEESIKQTYRYSTMAARHAAVFLPVVGEWRGTGHDPAMLFSSRRGMPVELDLYHSPTSYSGVVFAESGAGKSFFTNRLIVDYLSLGGKIWVFDVGRSYFKLCKLLGGEFMEFSEDSNICLNPFTHVTDIDEDLDVLKALIGKMASPGATLSAYQMASVEEAIKQCWGRYGPHTTVTHLAEYFRFQEDPRETDLSRQLFPFTRDGSYGRFFDGDNNLQFENRFVVLELDHLKSKRTLQQVVLLQLLARIQAELFLRPERVPRMIIVDEAWELLAERDGPGDQPGMVAQFLEASYRKLRKATAGAVVVTQSIRDLASTSAGRAIAENAPFRFILAQRPESIDAALREGLLAMTPDKAHVMKTIHTQPGKYSEVLVDCPLGWGTMRLIEDRFTQVLFSTRGPERDEVMAAINAGVPPIRAIEDFIERHG